jgi:hypothetical protein
MGNKLRRPTGHCIATILAVALTTFLSGQVGAQNAPAKINWGNTETQTSPAPAGAFKQVAPQQTAPLQATAPAQNSAGARPVANTRAKKSARSLSQLDDKAVIFVDGKQTTAGALKQSIKAALAKIVGGIKTAKSGSRKLDVSGFHVVSATQKISTGKASAFAVAPVTMHTQSLSIPATGSDPSKPKVASIRGTNHALCKDNGPPTIDKLSGALISGREVGVYGRCLGERTGSVQLIGPFPGGKMTLPFKHWDSTGVILDVPANIRGIQDQTVSISVITAEGKSTSALPVKFVAAREVVEVPERMWSPSAGFALSATADNYSTTNSAYKGEVVKTVRINPQCALSEMTIDAQAGGATGIRGFEQGIANEANVTIDWAGACTDTTWTTVHHDFIVQEGDDISFTSACNISFKARAWAYCPLGISP